MSRIRIGVAWVIYWTFAATAQAQYGWALAKPDGDKLAISAGFGSPGLAYGDPNLANRVEDASFFVRTLKGEAVPLALERQGESGLFRGEVERKEVAAVIGVGDFVVTTRDPKPETYALRYAVKALVGPRETWADVVGPTKMPLDVFVRFEDVSGEPTVLLSVFRDGKPLEFRPAPYKAFRLWAPNSKVHRGGVLEADATYRWKVGEPGDYVARFEQRAFGFKTIVNDKEYELASEAVTVAFTLPDLRKQVKPIGEVEPE
ncbi:MAG TPA: hypothetical protein VGE52_21810 [Pirellulales bacterium]